MTPEEARTAVRSAARAFASNEISAVDLRYSFNGALFDLCHGNGTLRAVSHQRWGGFKSTG